jgi:hypothetical protein
MRRKKNTLFKNLAVLFFKGGLYVLGHVSRGELSECKHDPVGRELPDWLALVDHLKVGIFIQGCGSRSGSSFSLFHFYS